MTVTRARARLRARMSAASTPLNRVFTGTSTAPAWSRPSTATIHSALLGAHSATRSPASMPEATSAAPNSSRPARQLGIAEPLIAVHHRRPVRPAGHGGGQQARDRPPVGGHRTTLSSTFISRARLPPMILRTVASGTPASSST